MFLTFRFAFSNPGRVARDISTSPFTKSSPYSKNKIDNDNQAKLLKQSLDVRKKVFTGIGYVTAFRPGEVFELTNHPLDGFDGKYLLTDVNHELRFEDKKGSEEIFVHAQKDYNEVVENSHDLKVHSTQTYTIDDKYTGMYHGGR